MERLAFSWSEQAWQWFAFFWVLALAWVVLWHAVSASAGRSFVGARTHAVPGTAVAAVLTVALSTAAVWYFGFQHWFALLVVVFIAQYLTKVLSVWFFNAPFVIEDWSYDRAVRKAGGLEAYLKMRADEYAKREAEYARGKQ